MRSSLLLSPSLAVDASFIGSCWLMHNNDDKGESNEAGVRHECPAYHTDL